MRWQPPAATADTAAEAASAAARGKFVVRPWGPAGLRVDGVVVCGDTRPPPFLAVSFYFRDLSIFGDSKDPFFWDTTTDNKTGLLPDPTPRTVNRQKNIAKFVFAISIKTCVLYEATNAPFIF